jgi:hypothetical protein
VSVYVDEVTKYAPEVVSPSARVYGSNWCHMWCDVGDEGELHRIAAAVGLQRSWYQTKASVPHYDLTASRRSEAVRHGAIHRSLSDWMRAETPEQRQARRERLKP